MFKNYLKKFSTLVIGELKGNKLCSSTLKVLNSAK